MSTPDLRTDLDRLADFLRTGAGTCFPPDARAPLGAIFARTILARLDAGLYQPAAVTAGASVAPSLN